MQLHICNQRQCIIIAILKKSNLEGEGSTIRNVCLMKNPRYVQSGAYQHVRTDGPPHRPACMTRDREQRRMGSIISNAALTEDTATFSLFLQALTGPPWYSSSIKFIASLSLSFSLSLSDLIS